MLFGMFWDNKSNEYYVDILCLPYKMSRFQLVFVIKSYKKGKIYPRGFRTFSKLKCCEYLLHYPSELKRIWHLHQRYFFGFA